MSIRGRLILLLLSEILFIGQLILIITLTDGHIGLDSRGLPWPTDFIGPWSAGQFVLQGSPELAYDWVALENVQKAILHTREEYFYPYSYPPHALFLATVLASLPYAIAFYVFSFGTALPPSLDAGWRLEDAR